jgi:hypothetical protein
MGPNSTGTPESRAPVINRRRLATTLFFFTVDLVNSQAAPASRLAG